jgi:hypothetical protein
MSSPSSSPSSSRSTSTNSVSSNASRRSSSNLTPEQMEEYFVTKRQNHHNKTTRPRSKSVGAVPSGQNNNLSKTGLMLAKELAQIERTKPRNSNHKGGYKKTKTNKTKTNKTKTNKSKTNKSKKTKSKTKNRH